MRPTTTSPISLFARKKMPLQVALICASLCSASVSFAAVLDGRSATVDASSTVESWSLMNAAVLNVTAGGATTAINATTGSTLNITSGTVDGRVSLSGSSATISSASISGAANGTGLSLGRTNNAGIISPASQAVVTGSTVTGSTSGATVSSESVLSLSNTQVIGTAAGSTGMWLLGASVAATNGSHIVGEDSGIRVQPNKFPSDPANRYIDSSIMIDASTVEGKNGSAILVEGNSRGGATADITVQNGASLIGGNGTILSVKGNSSADFKVDNSVLTGDVVVESGSNADVTLRNNASLTGQLTNVANLAVNSGAAWNMVDDASVGAVNMDGGAINFGVSPAFRTLTLGSLSGTGNFFMNIDVAANTGDLLNVTGSATGNYNLHIKNSGIDPVKAEQLQVVHTGGGDAQFSVAGGAVDVGTYRYLLQQQGNDWHLVGTNTITPSTGSVLGLFNAAPTVFYGELTTLRERMGELRMGNNNGGAWARTYGRKYNVSTEAGSSYHQQQYGLSIGADSPIPIKDGQLLVGALAGYSQSDLDFNAGTNGKIDSYYLGAYATWLSDTGYYLDGVIKANRFNNKADISMSDGTRANGSYNNASLGGSLEFGRHIALENAWFVEPFVQLAAVWVDGKNYNLDNGMIANNDGTSSLQAKLGTAVGRNYNLANGGAIRPYMKVAVVQEFAKNNKVHVNSNEFNNELAGTRGEVGVGVAAQLSKATQLHANLDYSHGRNIELPWGFNIGLRYNW